MAGACFMSIVNYFNLRETTIVFTSICICTSYASLTFAFEPSKSLQNLNPQIAN